MRLKVMQLWEMMEVLKIYPEGHSQKRTPKYHQDIMQVVPVLTCHKDRVYVVPLKVTGPANF